MRIEGNGTRYFSFDELPGVHKTQKPKKQNENSKEKFAGKCKICGSLLSFVEGTNVMVCKNPQCKGLKTKGEENNLPSFRFLDTKGMQIANNLFGKEDASND